MLNKIRNKLDEFNIYDLDNLVVIVSFILFIISLYYITNIYVIVFLYLFILYISRYYEKNIIKFICFVLPILLLGYFLLLFINLNFIEKEVLKTLRIIIKILMGLNYLNILYFYFKTKKVKQINSIKRKNKKYTFKELRRKNIDKCRESYNSFLDEYLENNKISFDSDYFKVIEKNIDNKINNNLEEYVWINYLRFYKNQKYRRYIFSVFNLLCLLIHVIILTIVLIVR